MERINPVYINAEMPKAETPQEEKTQQVSDRPQTDLGVLNNYKRDLVKPAAKAADDDDDVKNYLDKFVYPKNLRTFSSHKMYYFMDKNMFSILKRLTVPNDCWIQTPLKGETVCPWKMHIYADTEEDWVKLVYTVGRYLNTKTVDWKTISGKMSIDELNTDEMQKGKAFTIYPQNKEQFKQLAKDIDYIVRLNGLEKADTKITGDRQLGSTGRIFYRYELNSGADKDRVFHEDNDAEMDERHEKYDANRGEDKYLAADMTTADDPFYDFDPSK